MGPTPGRILLNGNAESIERFVRLADQGLGESRHRDPIVRARDHIVVCTGAWGPGELNDAPIHRRLAEAGRGSGGRFTTNLALWTSMQRFLDARHVVKQLYDEHETVWWELFKAYSAENGATVANLRAAWDRARERFPDATMRELLTMGDRRPPGPRTRPASVFLRVGYGRSVQRAVNALQDADSRHAATLRGLWTHFHVAAGLEFDPLWQQLRSELVEKLLTASVLLLPGGSPSRLLTGFRFFQLEGVLAEALRRGTSFFGTSAGAMVLGRRMVIFNDRAVPRQEFQLLDNGVRLVEGLQIFPHVTDRVQTEDPANLAYLAARFQNRRCVGLNQGSVLELLPEGGRWKGRSIGEEDVVLFGPSGEKVRYPPGTDVTDLQ
jgi:hypothetical protein